LPTFRSAGRSYIDVEQHVLEDRAQAARAGLALHGLRATARSADSRELDLHALHVEELAVLLRERVARRGQNAA
jgi:hypothetical protein